MSSEYARRSPSGVDGAPLARTAPRPTIEELEERVREALVNYGTWRQQQPKRTAALAALSELAARAREAESGAGLIAAERQRQIDSEGWDAAHDDAHDQGEMAKAAAAYAMLSYGSAHAYEFWPWHSDWWNPGRDRIGTLVKAGALIAAEIDRLQRSTP